MRISTKLLRNSAKFSMPTTRSKRKLSALAEPAASKKLKKTNAPSTAKRKSAKKGKVDLCAKERGLTDKGFKCIVGCDEAGRGPLAGPVVSAAVHMPPDMKIEGVADSKTLLQEKIREEVYERITNDKRVRWATQVHDRHVIDELNILQAAMKGMADSVDKLIAEGLAVDYVLVDGPHKPRTMTPDVECEPVVKGDSKVHAIAAASIIAKVTRDRIMHEYDKVYPQYNFSQHKGYPTPEHKALVSKHGPCDIHRRSFNPVKTMLGWTRPGEKKVKGKKKTKRKKGGKKKARKSNAKKAEPKKKGRSKKKGTTAEPKKKATKPVSKKKTNAKAVTPKKKIVSQRTLGGFRKSAKK